MEEQVALSIEEEGAAAVVVFRTAAISDYEGIAAAAAKIRQFVQEHSPHRVIFDFEQVRFFSSQVLGLLLEVRARLNESNGEVLISAINPQLHRVFTITNLDSIFRFFPDRESALAASGAA